MSSRMVITVLFALFAIASALPQIGQTSSESLPAFRDVEPNNTMEDAEEVFAGGSFVEGALAEGDIVDIYKVFLNADEELNGKEADKAIIYLEHLSGSTVMVEVSEGWGGPLVVLTASNGQSQGEFIVPHTDYYYLTVKTSPGGGVASYRLQVGVEKVDVSSTWDGNNRPADSNPVLQTTHISFILNPLSNIVNYYYHTLKEGFKIKVETVSEADNLHVELLNESLELLDAGGVGDPPEYGFAEGADETVYIRVYLRVDNSHPATNVDRGVEMDITIWSYTTTPEVNPADPWDEPLVLQEDTPYPSALNLTHHFIERGGDPLTFSMDENPYLNVTIHPLGTVDINPVENWWGTTSLTFYASDLDGMASDTIQVNVAPVNDPPSILKLNGIGAHPARGYVAFWVVVENTLTIIPEVVDVDDADENLSFRLNQTPENLVLNPVNGTIVYSPLWEDVGMHWVNLIVEDGKGGVDNTTIRIEAVGYNRPPNPPEIYVVEEKQNMIAGKPLNFVAILHGDPDGDAIVNIIWDMGDGRTYEGKDRITHTYAHPGNYTVTLKISDFQGAWTNVSMNITILPKPSQGDYLSGYHAFWKDEGGDVVVCEKRQTTDVLRLKMEGRGGVDILNLTAEGRSDGLLITLQVKDGVIIDGSVKYTIYLVKSDFVERPVNLNISRFEDFLAPAFYGTSGVFMYRTFSGILNNPFNFTIQGGSSLVLFIPLQELLTAEVPLKEGNFSIFAVSEESSQKATKTGQRIYYKAFDTAGEGATTYNVTSGESSGTPGGEEKSVFADNTLTFALLGVAAVLLLGFTALLLRRYRKREREEAEKFEEEVRKLREEGRSLYEMVEGESSEGGRREGGGRV